VLAAYGPRDRAEAEPWVPLASCAKAAAEAAVAVKFLFYEMPVVQKKWCGYCIIDAAMHIGTFAFTLPEAWDAATRVRSKVVETRKEIAA
jgi:hypothetical protein